MACIFHDKPCVFRKIPDVGKKITSIYSVFGGIFCIYTAFMRRFRHEDLQVRDTGEKTSDTK